MSRQLVFSSTISVMVMAAFALSMTVKGQAAVQSAAAPSASVTQARPLA